MLRHADGSDVPAVAALLNLAFRGAGPVASWNSEAGYIDGDRTSVALLRAELRDHPAALLLVEDGVSGKLAASVLIEPVGDAVWQLGSLAVDPGRQNEGAGRRLLAEAEQRAREAGARTMRMKVVNVRDTLIAWYLRRGYSLTGRTDPFPYSDDRFGRPLRPDLCFVWLEKPLRPEEQGSDQLDP